MKVSSVERRRDLSERRRLRAVPPAPRTEAGADDPPEVTAAFEAYRITGDRADRNRLVERHRSLAEALACRYARRGEPIADLQQVAFLGLVKAVERFNPATGVPFAGFAVPTITGELRRHFRDHTWALKVGRTAKDLNVRTPEMTERLTGEFGRAPNPAELAEALGCSVDEVIAAIDAGAAYRPTSVDTKEGRWAAESRLLTTRGSQGVDIDERAMLRDLLAELPDRDRTIVGLRYFEDLTQAEIGQRVGMSQVHVSRVLRSALNHMSTVAAAS